MTTTSPSADHPANRTPVKRIVTVYVLCILTPAVCLAQAPAGTIAGVVHDPSGAVIASAQVQAISRATAQARTTVTTEEGEYSFPALPVGEYEVRVETRGFRRIVRAATVEAGTTTTVHFTLSI